MGQYFFEIVKDKRNFRNFYNLRTFYVQLAFISKPHRASLSNLRPHKTSKYAYKKKIKVTNKKRVQEKPKVTKLFMATI